MAGVAADRLARRLERLDLAVDGEHLLDEGAAEMEQPHLERAFVLGAQAGPGFLRGTARRRTGAGRARSAPGRWRCRPRRRRGCGSRRRRRIAGRTRSGRCGRSRRWSGSPSRRRSAPGAARWPGGASSARGRSPFLPRGGSNAVGSRKMSMSSENRWIRFQPFDRLVPPLKMTWGPAACSMMRRASVTK